MTAEQIGTFVQAGISAVSGLGGALIGGVISMRQSRESIKTTFSHQLQIESLRYKQKLEAEDLERERQRTALRRSLIRSLKRLRNTARLSPKARITLKSWSTTASTFTAKMEQPDVDMLLSDSEHEALWEAAGEAGAAAAILSRAAEVAIQGHALNILPLQATVELFRETLRDAFKALSETALAREVEEERKRGIRGCGIFVDDNFVFYPEPTDGRTFIVRVGEM